MGLGGQVGAHQGYVGGVDEVEAGLGTQPLSKPQPAGCLPNPSGEITGGMAVARTHLPAKYQGWKYGNNFGGQGVGLQLLQAESLGLDVFSAKFRCLGQQLQLAIQN